MKKCDLLACSSRFAQPTFFYNQEDLLGVAQPTTLIGWISLLQSLIKTMYYRLVYKQYNGVIFSPSLSFFLLRPGFSVYTCLSWNPLHRSGWPLTPRSTSASVVLELKLCDTMPCREASSRLIFVFSSMCQVDKKEPAQLLNMQIYEMLFLPNAHKQQKKLLAHRTKWFSLGTSENEVNGQWQWGWNSRFSAGVPASPYTSLLLCAHC